MKKFKVYNRDCIIVLLVRPIVVKSHLFPQFIDLRQSLAVGTGEKERGRQSIAVGWH